MIGIDITNTMIHAVSGKASDGGIAIQAYASVPLPVFIKSDGSSDKQAVADAIRQVLTPEFKGPQVTVLFSESEVVSHQYEFPYEKNPVAMYNIVRSGVSQTLDAEHYVMDYAVLDVLEKDGGKFCTVQVYLARRQMVDFASQVISMAGRKPYSFQVAENALYNMHCMANGLHGKDLILASLGSARVNITLFTGRASVVMRCAGVMAEAEAFSAVKNGLFQNTQVGEVAGEQISKMIQYKTIKEPGRKVENIYIFGDYASPDMAAAISQPLGERAMVLPIPGNITAPAGFKFEKYAHAVGALIEK